MTAKEESDRLLTAVLPLAQAMLKQYGEFHPYGGYMKPDGTIVDAGAADPDTDQPRARDLIFVLRTSFQEMARENKCKATAIVVDVAVNLPTSGRKSDAIQISIEHIDGYSAEVFLPYQIVDNEITYGEMFAQEGGHDMFKRT